ncbi:hypothetical protein ACOID8_34515, partial [Klebsiella pneumoniae]|uniref:hypothetical protein n=1 Tax=Klebsiella pneumoniae TaxID=573 RepID=UPI003B5AE4AA
GVVRCCIVGGVILFIVLFCLLLKCVLFFMLIGLLFLLIRFISVVLEDGSVILWLSVSVWVWLFIVSI